MRAGDPGPRRRDWRSVPHPSRLGPEAPHRGAALARHERAQATGLSTYLDPATGYTVLTADYLAGRGACCGSGCRHCPWEGGADDPEVS